MSVSDFLSDRENYMRLREQITPAYLVVANMIWNRAESMSAIALFDTQELAEQYIAASRLSEPEAVDMPDRSGHYAHGQIRKMWLCHRADSLLREFNGGWDCRVIVAPVEYDYSGIPINPTAPSP